MSAPRTKRQFAGAASDPAQRQITSFFTTSNASSSPSCTNTNLSHTAQPASGSYSADASSHLSHTVQANLISVGMRVRKSVPEGYKTGTYSAFALWDENNNAGTIPGAGEMAAANEGRSRANAFSTPRELLPFCGINKVGGMDTQPEHPLSISTMTTTHASTSTSYHHQPIFSLKDAPLLGDMPGLTSSQGSMDSTDSNLSTDTDCSPVNARKRFFTEDENENEALEIPDRLNIWRHHFDGDVSPRSLAPVGWGPGNGRILAMPRKGRLRSKMVGHAARGGCPGPVGIEQENVMVVDSDFEEAAFLDQKAWEVDMSDA
ncbi:Uu.00g113930.m01.CDS01 [Anthostomella pinea]|uniref:Uu.00g113930.m01.CDS01 n=1 Tax=Anthostomella pinea TaxID=933095 RepID=A0AAI8VGM2_9PEZI|nr:Uu.00g113930.m01.CDS01 [Anthostomella pinea]